MTTTMQIRAQIDTAQRFKAVWKRLQTVDPDVSQGETLGMALSALERELDGKSEKKS